MSEARPLDAAESERLQRLYSESHCAICGNAMHGRSGAQVVNTETGEIAHYHRECLDKSERFRAELTKLPRR